MVYLEHDRYAAMNCDFLNPVEKTAIALCESLSEELSLPPSSFDTGTYRIDYSAGGGKLPICDGQDYSLEAREIYQAFLRIAPAPQSAQKSTAIFAKKFGKSPLQFDDKHKDTAATIVANVREKIAGATEDVTYATANALLQAIRAPKKRGGLGIKFRDHKRKEADVNGVIDRKYAHCSEFQTLFYALGKMLGLKMYPVEVPQTGRKREDIPHTAVMIVDEITGKRYFADLELDHIQRQSPYKEYYVGTETDIFANYLYNKDEFLLAEEIAPDNDVVMGGVGTYYWRLGDASKAARYFRKAFELRPTNLIAMRKYCLATFDFDVCKLLP